MQHDKSKIAAAPFRLSWPAIFGGMFATVGVWLMLHTLGLAIGVSQLEPSNSNNLRAIGIGSGIWIVLASMASFFVGGVVTARSAGLLGRSNAGLHGIVLWGATTVGGLVLIGSVVASLARGVTVVSLDATTVTPDTGQAAEAARSAEPGAAGASTRRDDSVRMEQTALTRAFWSTCVMMLLSLTSSVLGTIAGVTRRQQELSAQAAQLPPGPIITPRPAELRT